MRFSTSLVSLLAFGTLAVTALPTSGGSSDAVAARALEDRLDARATRYVDDLVDRSGLYGMEDRELQDFYSSLVGRDLIITPSHHTHHGPEEPCDDEVIHAHHHHHHHHLHHLHHGHHHHHHLHRPGTMIKIKVILKIMFLDKLLHHHHHHHHHGHHHHHHHHPHGDTQITISHEKPHHDHAVPSSDY